jgi:hypothetical protein
MDHRKFLAEAGRKGGKAGRGAAKARRPEQARAAAKARWDKWRAKQKGEK